MYYIQTAYERWAVEASKRGFEKAPGETVADFVKRVLAAQA